MRIGELAKRTGTEIETVRYYEKSGLLAEPARNAAGYREYREEHQERLQFIRHCRSLQMSLADIRVLLELKGNPTTGCQGVNELLDHHIERIRAQMDTLRTLETQLTSLRDQCGEPHSVQECAIIQNLSESAGNHECACHT
ncbi:Cd(II)/Pb(II)-responsive transcriptional regulator [Noviherbaspirillum sedimenti]|uniref:Cd(II)/Pb(II)-responsive transcriptional regulator n=1 Tax=Noviherbaspirillum sedimenti TaxID=2320865 RepID=A0A3A3G4S6_9BURK|nr:Cd(II)/Pb(II)-responsive transcriptional regulator [Noviherbaspirillum sedimenti]RJG03513.1 Cd(II)/Pb(II)-responsive transcriptional regulator [Noviherbaspirillum sedimenti]